MMLVGLVLLGLVALVKGTYDVEVYFAVDKKTEDLYSASRVGRGQLTEEINYIISEMTSYYDTLNLGIKIYKRDLTFLGRNVESTSDAYKILAGFKTWLTQNRKYNTLKYDLAILLTGYDLTYVVDGKRSSGVSGLADMRRVCQQGAGIVEMRKEYNTASTLAHEIGHIMGADHDGERSGYIMANSTGPGSKYRWTFSGHSRGMVSQHLSKIIRTQNCFRERSRQSTLLTNVPVPKSLNSPNKICKRTHGNNAYMCGGDNQGGDSVCTSFFCNVDRSGECPGVMTYDGMTCGNKKSCKKGKCVRDSNAPASEEGCPWGDVEYVSLRGGDRKTCEDIMSSYGIQNCASMKTKCCKTCAQHGGGSGNNGGGGGGGGGKPRPPVPQPTDGGNGGTGGCQDGRGTITLTSNTGKKTGSCSSLVTSQNKQVCESLENFCCATCRRYASSDASCKYGDKSSSCSQYSPSVICRGNEAICCETCRNYKREVMPDAEIMPEGDPKNITMQDLPVDVYSTS